MFLKSVKDVILQYTEPSALVCKHYYHRIITYRFIRCLLSIINVRNVIMNNGMRQKVDRVGVLLLVLIKVKLMPNSNSNTISKISK